MLRHGYTCHFAMAKLVCSCPCLNVRINLPLSSPEDVKIKKEAGVAGFVEYTIPEPAVVSQPASP